MASTHRQSLLWKGKQKEYGFSHIFELVVVSVIMHFSLVILIYLGEEDKKVR